MDSTLLVKPKEIAVTLKASSFFYDKETDCYRVKFSESQLISHDTLKKIVILLIPSNKVQPCSQTQQLKDEDIDNILDEIAAKEKYKKTKKTRQDDKNISPRSRSRSRSHSHTQNLTKSSHSNDDIKDDQIPSQHSPIPKKDQLTQKFASIPKPRKEAQNANHKLDNKHNNKLTKSMRKQWLLCCGHNEEDCDGSNALTCVALKRIKFALQHYASWMKYKSLVDDQESDDDSSDGDSSDGASRMDAVAENELIMRNYEHITDFFDDLSELIPDNAHQKKYNCVQLCDDFEHIRDYHMKLNKNKTSLTIDYFDKLLGKCVDKECCSLARHCRDRHIDNINENKRREIFFIREKPAHKPYKNSHKKDKNGENKVIVKQNTVGENKMYFEINLQTKLDTIHITLRHHHLRLINTDKFITKINDNNTNNGADAGDADRERPESKDIFGKMKKYSFGESITYWDNKHHRYCKSKYADIRSELLNNKIYPLSLSLYLTIRACAHTFLLTKKGQSLRGLREHDWMKKWKILRGSLITVDHVIALLCYVNVTALRRVFKLHGYIRGEEKDSSRDKLLLRHSEIWHWSRLLLECVHCYGVPINSNNTGGNKQYYHGIDCKLLFNRFNVMFDIPTSLTLNRDIAYNLSKTINAGRGIAIELSHGELSDLQSLSFDLSFVSDYPSEEEQLIFHSYLSFADIIINRMHHDEWLKILRFWYKIKEGFFFNHLIEANVITRNDQLCICAMIINMIIADESHERYDNRIPKYMQKLFNQCVENQTFVWMIQSQYKKMIKKLQNLLAPNSQFIKYLVKYKKCNVCNANIFNWIIKDGEKNNFYNLFNSKNKWIKSPKYTVYISDSDSKQYLQFHFEAQNKYKNGLFRCRIHLDHKPENVSKINLGMGLFCKYANNFDNYSYGELRYDKLYNVSLHSLFKTKLLKKNLDKFNLKEFELKLQIQLFYIYDFNGKIIKINQSTIKNNMNFID